LSGYIFATKACIDNRKKNLFSSNISSTGPYNMVNFSLLAAEIVSLVWGTRANFNWSPDMRSLFEDVELLARLLMVCPATSCEAKRSFSAVYRLKTWLRNSTSQVRLNAAAVCHVHKDHLDSVSDTAVAAVCRQNRDAPCSVWTLCTRVMGGDCGSGRDGDVVITNTTCTRI